MLCFDNKVIPFTIQEVIRNIQRSMTKIVTKEKYQQHVLNLILSGSISKKEVIEFDYKHPIYNQQRLKFQ